MCPRRMCGIIVLLTLLLSQPVEIMSSKQGTVDGNERSSALDADNPMLKVIVPSTHWNDSSKSCSDFCSPWVYCDNGKCWCGEVPDHTLQCNVQKNVSLLDNNCLTYNEDKHLAEVGRCIFTSINTISPYTILPRSLSELDSFMCGEEFNRTGTLCGKCKDDHYPLVYSFDMNCIRCPNGKANWWKYVLAAYFPLTIFYLVVLLFKINVASSTLYPFVIYAQAVSIPTNKRIVFMFLKHQKTAQTATRWMEMLYGVWNLDFFCSFNLGICLGIDTIQALALELAVGVYPLLLLLATYMS